MLPARFGSSSVLESSDEFKHKTPQTAVAWDSVYRVGVLSALGRPF